jgi:hypothetical protein
MLKICGCCDAKFYKIMNVGMQSFTHYGCWDASLLLKSWILELLFPSGYIQAYSWQHKLVFLVSPTRELSACQTHDNSPFSTIFFPSFFSDIWLQSLKDRVRTSVGLVYMPVPGININSKDHTSLVGVQAMPALYQRGRTWGSASLVPGLHESQNIGLGRIWTKVCTLEFRTQTNWYEIMEYAGKIWLTWLWSLKIQVHWNRPKVSF